MSESVKSLTWFAFGVGDIELLLTGVNELLLTGGWLCSR
jgi:hypothetical protein